MTEPRSRKFSRSADGWGIGAGLVLISACIVAGIYYSSFTLFDCSNDRVSHVTSIDGKTTANIVRRDCGATTNFVTSVYLKEMSLNKKVAENWGDEIYAIEGDANVAVQWEEGSKIRIVAPTSGESVILKKDDWNGIKIFYEYF